MPENYGFKHINYRRLFRAVAWALLAAAFIIHNSELLHATTVSGTVRDSAGNAVSGGAVSFRLINIGRGNVARVTGTSIVAPELLTATTAADGTFAATITGNDAITPSGTLYEVVIRGPGFTYGPFDYSITGASADLNSLTPEATFPNTASQVAASQLVPPSGCASNQVLQWTGTAWTCGAGGSGAQHQVNGTNVTTNTTVNFENSLAANGLTLTFANPSAGNVQLGLSGGLTDAGLATAYSGVGACGANQWIFSLARAGAPSCSQPAFASLTGQATAAQLPSTINASAIQDKGGQVYNVRAYGAKGDGIAIYNCSITTGTAALACSTATFTSADVGKAIEVDGAAASSGNLVTTISAFTDATHVTIGTNASTTTSTANVVYGTDDSAAIQTLINTLNSAAGGTLFFPNGLYILAGTPSATNFMLEIPARANNGTVPMITIGFAGSTIPTASGARANPPVSTGTLYGMEQVVAGGGLLGADPFSGSFSEVNVAVHNMQFMTPPNPNYILVRLNYAYSQTVSNLNLIANKPPNNVLPATPTSTQGLGLQFGGDAGLGLATNVYVQGIYTGFTMQDHSSCINCYAQSVFTGFLITGGSHTRNIFGGLVQNATRALDLRTSTRVMAQVDFETNTYDLYTDGSAIKGFIVANDPGASIASKMNATSPNLIIQDENAGSLVGAFGNYPMTFATAPACAAGTEGQQRSFTDSTTATHAATITGGGANHVLGYCNATNWVVAYP